MQDIINKAIVILAKKHNINSNALEYIGNVDCSWKGDGFVQVQFNINCDGHKHNHSTVAVNSWNL